MQLLIVIYLVFRLCVKYAIQSGICGDLDDMVTNAFICHRDHLGSK